MQRSRGNMTLKILKESLIKSKIIKRGNYSYFIHPITDGIPEVKPDLLNEVICEMEKRIRKYGRIDKIVTVEAMGIPLATALSTKMKIPFVIIRKKPYELPNEIVVEQTTGYSKSRLYINGLKQKDKIIIVDDVLSTGGTIKAVIPALKKFGVDLKGVIIVVDRGNIAKELMKEFDINIESIVKIDIINDKIVIKEG
jgi:adenine phosphoribosyltransferase